MTSGSKRSIAWTSFIRPVMLVEREDAASAKPHVVSDTMIESLRVHAPASVARVKMTEAALREAVASRAEHHPVRRIVELGTVSRLVTARFADIAAKAGAVLVVVETNESALSELSIAFESNPNVSVIRPSELKQAGPVDLIVSAADHVFTVASGDGVSDAIGAILAPGSRLVLCTLAPSAFADFANGLSEGWFDRGKSVEFPLGQIASAEDWEALLRFLPVDDVKIIRHALANGPVISVEASARRAAEAIVAPATATGHMLVVTDGKAPAKGPARRSDFNNVRLGSGSEKDFDALTGALTQLENGDINVVYVPEPIHGDGVDWLRSCVMRLRFDRPSASGV